MAAYAGIEYRRADRRDIFSLMNLYQLSTPDPFKDKLLLNHTELTRAIESPDAAWVVADKKGELLACLAILLDRDHRIAKIHRFFVSPFWEGGETMLSQSMPLLITYLKGKGTEVLYTTTGSLTLKQQEVTLSMGFRTLGIFPNAVGADLLSIGGLSGYFFEGVLSRRRYQHFQLHSVLRPFYEIVSRECGLPPVDYIEPSQIKPVEGERVPVLEMIPAPDFVAHRFDQLKERRTLSVQFYPFHPPNALITDPSQGIEIFIKLIPEERFAAIVGERMERSVNPTELYRKVAWMLHQQGVSYIEVINDAADPVGIDCFLKAGYLPCAYFPSFKSQGDWRRDYVVMARSFEKNLGNTSIEVDIHPIYLEFLKTYYRIEETAYLERLLKTPLGN